MSVWDTWWLLIPTIVVWFLCYRSRVVRILVLIVVALAVAVFPALQRAYISASQQDSSIVRNYSLDYDVQANGDQRLIETFDVEFTETRRGIFRFFDEKDGVDPDVTHPVTVESVKRCGVRETAKCVSEPFTTYYEDGLLVAKIGSQDRPYPPGTVNRYVITSTTTGALTQPEGQSEAQWYWNVVPPGGRMQTERTQVRVTLPVEPDAVRCLTDSGPCTTRERGRTVTGVYDNLPVRTPVTWQVDLPPQGLSVVPVSPSPQWWRSPLALIPGLVLALLLAFLIWRLRERPASTAPVFAEPTRDILPAAWTWREESPEHPYQTILMQLAVLGTVKVEVEGGATRGAKPDWVKVWREPDPIPEDVTGAEEFIDRMDLDAPGSVVKIEKDSVTIGKKVQATETALESQAETGAARVGYFQRSNLGFLTHLIASGLAPLALLVLVWTSQRWLAAMLLVPAVVGIWSNRSLRTRLTAAGLAMRDQVTGLRTALSTPASVERYDYAAKVRYFAQFLPWAIALDCAEKWAEICAPPPGTEPGSSGYDASYAAAWNSYNASEAVSSAVASVSAGAVASYAATQSSSSSGGGGGFSSGGGSGGGGSGSW